ncbi:MAG: threonine aldolase family protein, partial [Myxococcota bacterium]
MAAPIDLRSDTVTQPTEAMREAMARAEVGDDVFGEDPTLNRLQESIAERLGHEAALFVPSGTMANQIALLTWCRPGDDVIVPRYGHMYAYETGAASALAGVMLTVLDDALYTADDLHAHVKPDNHRSAPTRLVVVENTHNHAGGRVWPLEQLRSVSEACRAHGLPLHMDGARLFNAAIASGTALHDYGQTVDALSLCATGDPGCTASPRGATSTGTDRVG